MVDDLIKPRWMSPNNMSEECEGSFLLQLIVGLLKTLLKLIEDVNVVRVLNFHENLEYPLRVCV